MEMVYDIFTTAPRLLIISEMLIFPFLSPVKSSQAQLELDGIDHELAIEVYNIKPHFQFYYTWGQNKFSKTHFYWL